MATLKERVKDILLREKILSPEDLDRVLEEQASSEEGLSQILVRMGFVDDEKLSSLLSEGLDLPMMNISRFKADPVLIALIPMDVLKKNLILPVSRIGDNLSLAMADPSTGLNVMPLVSRGKDIQDALDQLSVSRNEDSFEKIKQDIKDAEDLELVSESLVRSESSIVNNLTEDAPILRLMTTIIRQAVVCKASDVFIEPMEKHVRIRYRVDGVLREIDRMAKALHFPIVSRIKVVSNLDISEHRLPQDGRFKTVLEGGKEVDFRVSVLPTAHGEKIVLRVLDKNLDRVDIEKLGFESEPLARLKAACSRPHGMVLACGPTGSGKTTTLYSVLKFIDTPGKNIVTVEDPVEYQMKGLNQVNIRFEVGLTFTATLRSILRQDPDVIMIGEIRDSETLDIAVKAALTGHLVLSSLHTTTAAGSIVRMINMGIEPFLICSAVNSIISQRLLRRVCPACRQDVRISQALYDKLEIGLLLPKKDLIFQRGKGCAKCLNSGYSGRLGINEVLLLTPAIKKLVLSRAGEIEIKAMARREGMITLREDAMIKASKGLTTLEEVVRVTAMDESATSKAAADTAPQAVQ